MCNFHDFSISANLQTKLPEKITLLPVIPLRIHCDFCTRKATPDLFTKPLLVMKRKKLFENFIIFKLMIVKGLGRYTMRLVNTIMMINQ